MAAFVIVDLVIVQPFHFFEFNPKWEMTEPSLQEFLVAEGFSEVKFKNSIKKSFLEA